MTATSTSFREAIRDDSSVEAPASTLGSFSGDEGGSAVAVRRVVLVHCSASSARQWRPLVAKLEGRQPIALDLWGHGDRASAQGHAPRTLGEEAQVITEACPDGASFHLVGHSYGGAVALNYALHHPGRVRSLTLIEPSCFHVLKTAPGNVAAQLDEIRAVAWAVDHGLAAGDHAQAMRGFMNYWSGTGFWAALADDRKAQFALLAPTIAAHFRSLIGDETVLATYARVVVPTLILCGTQSPEPSRLITRLLAETLPMARHRTIRGVNHMAPITHPDEVNPVVLAHLDEVDRDSDR